MCFQFVILLTHRPEQIVSFVYQDVNLTVTFNHRNWVLIGLGAERCCKTLRSIPSLQTCHVARACGYRSYNGTDDLSVSLPSHRSNISVTTEVLNVVVLWDAAPYNLVYSYGSCGRTCRCSTILRTTWFSIKLQCVTSQETLILTRNGVRRQMSDAVSVVYRALAQIQ